MIKKNFALCLSTLTAFTFIMSSCQKPPTKKKATATPAGQCVDDFVAKVTELKKRQEAMTKATSEKNDEQLTKLKADQDAQCKVLVSEYEKLNVVSCKIKDSKESITKNDVMSLCGETIQAQQKAKKEADEKAVRETKDICHTDVARLIGDLSKEKSNLTELVKDKKDTKVVLKSIYETCSNLISKLERNTKCKIVEEKLLITYDSVEKQCTDYKAELEKIEGAMRDNFTPAAEGQGAPSTKDESVEDEEAKLEHKKQVEAKVAELNANIDNELARISKVILNSKNSVVLISKDGTGTTTMNVPVEAEAHYIFYKSLMEKGLIDKDTGEVKKKSSDDVEKKQLEAASAAASSSDDASKSSGQSGNGAESNAVASESESKPAKAEGKEITEGFEELRKGLDSIKTVVVKKADLIRNSAISLETEKDKNKVQYISDGELKVVSQLVESGYRNVDKKLVACTFDKNFINSNMSYNGRLQLMSYRISESRNNAILIDMTFSKGNQIANARCFFTDKIKDLQLSDLENALKGVMVFETTQADK